MFYLGYRKKKKRRLNRLVIVALLSVTAAVIAILYVFRAEIYGPLAANDLNDEAVSSSARPVSSRAAGSSSVASRTPSLPAVGSLLMLVNKDHPLPESYTPTFSTVNISYYISSSKDNRFDSRAAGDLTAMISDARQDGVPLVIVSGYRSYEDQVEDFNYNKQRFVSEGYSDSVAASMTAVSVAPPGYSEHSTGLAADIVNSGWYSSHSQLTADFDKTAAFAWLDAHAADYGFILRYPKDKESVTKYEYEPWHYRYVGRGTAEKIKESGLCLEEYLAKYDG